MMVNNVFNSHVILRAEENSLLAYNDSHYVIGLHLISLAFFIDCLLQEDSTKTTIYINVSKDLENGRRTH